SDKIRSIGLCSFCFFRIYVRIPLCHMHLFPHILENRLVEDLNTPQSFSCAVTLCQSLQYCQFKFYFIRLLGPFAYAADTSVVKSVLTVRRSMKVDQNLKSVALRPVKRVVKFAYTSDKRLSVSENKIWNRDTDRIKSHGFDPCKIPFCNILGPVHFNTGLIHFFG